MIHVCRRPLFTRILPVIHFPDNFEQLLTDRRDRGLVADAGQLIKGLRLLDPVPLGELIELGLDIGLAGSSCRNIGFDR